MIPIGLILPIPREPLFKIEETLETLMKKVGCGYDLILFRSRINGDKYHEVTVETFRYFFFLPSFLSFLKQKFKSLREHCNSFNQGVKNNTINEMSYNAWEQKD